MTIITKGMGAIIKSVKKSSPMANVFEGAVKKLNKRGGIRSFGKNFKKTKKYIVRGQPHGKKFPGEEIIKRIHRDQFKRDIIATKIKATRNPKKTKGYMDTDPNVRKGIAKGLREHRKSDFYKRHKKMMKKLKENPDLSYMKGQLD